MKHRKIYLMGLMVLMLLFVTACGNKAAQKPSGTPSSGDQATSQPAKSANPTTIKVGLICGGMTPLIAEIGMNDGSFDKAGLKVEKVCFKAGSDAVKALIGGSINVNLGSYEHVLKMVQNGLGAKAYGEIFNGVGYSLLVKKDAPYQKLSDLKNATLAVTKPGTLSDTGLRKGLEKSGLNPDRDVKIISAGSGTTMLAAIESGKVSGGMVSEPTSAQMVASGKYRVLYNPDFEYAGIVIMAKSDWVNQNKDAMKTYLKVLKEVNARAQKDPKAAAQAMAKEFSNIPENVLEQAVKNQLTSIPGDLKVAKSGADMATQTAVQLKTISKPIPYDKAVDLTLLP